MKKIFFPILAFAAIASCTKVIDVDLNSATPKIVIEAALLAGTQDFSVKITKTGNYFGTDQPAGIADATVFLKRENETPIALGNDGNGNYSLPNFTATENTNYSLSVTAEGATFEASSFLPKAVKLDTLVLEVKDAPPFGGAVADSFDIFLHYNDPADEVNFYRIKSVVNGRPRNEGDQLLVIDDRLINGNFIQIPIFTDAFELNDTVEVELVSMDLKMFDYYNTLITLVSENGGSAAPANPQTNWSGGALGYFGAFSSSKRTVLVK